MGGGRGGGGEGEGEKALSDARCEPLERSSVEDAVLRFEGGREGRGGVGEEK